MYKLLILSHYADEYQRIIRDAHLPDLDVVATTDPAEAATLGRVCDLAFSEPSLIVGILSQLPSLRWLQATWAGVEPLLDASLRRDYILTNVRGVFGPLISEYVLGYLLLFERQILRRYAAQQAGRWDSILPGTLRGKQLGLLGVGSIGAYLAHTAKYFGMQVRGYTRASETCADVDCYYHGADRLAFAAGLDYLVCVLPGTTRTHHIVDASLLHALPSHAIFINVGRGSAVDEIALAAVLQTGQLAAAVLDVFNEEPLPSRNALWCTPNVYITAHTAAPNFPPDIAKVFIENYLRLHRGEALHYQVDFERGY